MYKVMRSNLLLPILFKSKVQYNSLKTAHSLAVTCILFSKIHASAESTHGGKYCGSYSTSCGDDGNKWVNPSTSSMKTEKVIPQNQENLKQRLSALQFEVTQEAGTERAFSGKYYDHHETGTYTCVVCGEDLFNSETKYESGSGWPSFFAPVSEKNVNILRDVSHGMVREEVRCSKCGSHLGHVFSDGPKPTGLRYCINSASLDFKNRE